MPVVPRRLIAEMPSSSPSLDLWQQRLAACHQVFSASGWPIFQALMAGWVMCPGRKTITGIYRLADPGEIRAHDAYHRFVRCGHWAVDALWKTLALAVITGLVPRGVIEVDIDDTLLHKSGRKMEGTGYWRDAVRSTGKRVVIALGLNLLVMTVRIRPPWGGMPIGLPVMVMLHRKGGEKLTDMAARALRLCASWFPDRSIRCCADGAFAAALIPVANSQITVISRIRRDAALNALPPKATGKRGRPRQRGGRLGKPTAIAKSARKKWKLVTTQERGMDRKRLVYCQVVLWYAVRKTPVLFVISRDPDGKEADDFWVCSDISLPPADVVTAYSGRWSIEMTFRDVKQTMGAHHPQSWAGNAPERAATLGFLNYTLVWWWYLGLAPAHHQVSGSSWYRKKCRPSFNDAIALIRRELWENRITATSDRGMVSNQITETLLNTVCRAA
jgi:hypothetical protein